MRDEDKEAGKGGWRRASKAVVTSLDSATDALWSYVRDMSEDNLIYLIKGHLAAV